MRGVEVGAAVLALVVTVAAGSLVVSTPAHANIFQVIAGPSPGCSQSSFTPVVVGCDYHGFASFGTGDAILTANAGLGGVGASADLTILGIPLISQVGIFESDAFEIVSYTVTGPTGATFNIRENLTVSGSFSGGCPERWFCRTAYAAILDAGGVARAADFATADRNGGLFAPPELVNTFFPTDFFTIVANEPFEIEYSLRVFATMNNFSEAGAGSISSDISATFGPARTGPVFDLPEGFTAFGPCVENNRFVCAEDGPPRQVPEPGTLALLTMGLAGFAVWRRGRG